MLGIAKLLPGAPALLIAARLGLSVVPADLPPDAQGAVRRGSGTILINRRLPRRDVDRVVAHEIFELSLSERLPDPLHERYCDLGAEALLGLR